MTKLSIKIDLDIKELADLIDYHNGVIEVKAELLAEASNVLIKNKYFFEIQESFDKVKLLIEARETLI